jgi:hypothetical protein
MRYHVQTRALTDAVEQQSSPQRSPKMPCTILLMFLAAPFCAAQTFDYTKQAELDDTGNIFVSSREGKLIWMADMRHCSETIFANDRQTVGCVVEGKPRGPAGLSPTPIPHLEIYLKGGQKKTIEPDAPILEWHFWENGGKVAVHSGLRVRQGTYALYESATARLVEKRRSERTGWQKFCGKSKRLNPPCKEKSYATSSRRTVECLIVLSRPMYTLGVPISK